LKTRTLNGAVCRNLERCFSFFNSQIKYLFIPDPLHPHLIALFAIKSVFVGLSIQFIMPRYTSGR